MRTGRSLTVCCSLPGPGGVCLVRGGVCSGGGLPGPGGGSAWSRGGGLPDPGGGSAPGRLGLLSGGSAPGEGGVYPSMHWGRHPPPSPCGQNSWHTLVKILPWPNFVAADNKNSFILERKNGSESDITSRWVHRESNLMFILSSNKDHRKKFTTAFTFGPCKWT